MAKLSGYRKCIKWLKETDGFRKVSTWASASSIENADGTTVENKLATVVANLASHISSTGNTHKITKNDIDLGNVDNTADADKSVKQAIYADTSGTANSVAWGNVSGKPSVYTPESHTHDDRYFTETEINNKLSDYSRAKFSYDSSTKTLYITN